MKLEKIFIGFRNHSLDETIKLNLDGSVSNKEKLLLSAVFENASNIINSFITELGANKEIDENDFDWTMFLYVSVCAQELHDILNRIEKTNDSYIKNALDVSKQDLINHLKKIFGGKDIDHLDNIFNRIESMEKESSNYNEFVVGRTLIIYSMLVENKVHIEKISSDKLLQISEENYKSSIVNFAKICAK